MKSAVAAKTGKFADTGMERSFAASVRQLQLGADDEFHGENILALTKALLQAGVSYIGGYPGAPVSHLMDVMAEARNPILEPLGVQFESSASEAGAAALLGASIHYPLRGAVTWKSVVGTNVASDALSHVASAGVTGGALIIVGEDYGEGASIMQERTHTFAMKSSIPLIDPRYHMPKIVELTELAFELSEASHLPVMMSLRIRAAHMTGTFICKDNRAPTFGMKSPLPAAAYDFEKVVLPPSTFHQEKAKFDERLPAAQRFIHQHGLNEHLPGAGGDTGIVLQGGNYGTVMRALNLLGMADAFGNTDLPLMVLNVIHPLVPEELLAFMRDKREVLIVEEGNPALIEQQLQALAHREKMACQIRGKQYLPEAGEYTADEVRSGIAKWLSAVSDGQQLETVTARDQLLRERAERAMAKVRTDSVPPRPPGFCTGCPERPIFSALKLLEAERGKLHISLDIGCSGFGSMAPFFIGSTILGYGMSLASSGATGPALGGPSIAVMGDGAFWHNGLATGAINALWNQHNAVLVILQNGYASATGQQHVPSTGSTAWGEKSNVEIENVLRAAGVTWLERVDAYKVDDTLQVLRRALDEPTGLRVIISDEECMLARQRREKRERREAEAAGKSARYARFGVDASVCTGDHSCIRMNGCPSLTVKATTDPLKDGPSAYVDNSCLACGLCGENAHAAALCPSFYRAERHTSPSGLNRLRYLLSKPLLRWLGIR